MIIYIFLLQSICLIHQYNIHACCLVILVYMFGAYSSHQGKYASFYLGPGLIFIV